MKGKQISLDKKLEIINAVEGNRGTQVEIAKLFDIPKTTLSSILKNRQSIRSASHTKKHNRIRKRVCSLRWPKLEEALLSWLKEVRSHNLPVNGPLFKEKAEFFAMRLGINDFRCSEGWFSRFKSRHVLSFRSVCGESGAVDKNVTENWIAGPLQELLKKYKPENVFNADETGVFYKALPSKTLAFRNEKCTGGKLSKQRLTVMVCANMTGTEKIRLLVVGKAKNPRCFKGIKSFPVDYESNKNSWITTNIFEKWVRKLDRKFYGQKRKVVLLVDNCSAHSEVDDLSSIELAFFPPNTTSVLQPMDQGVIRNLKVHYRHSVLRRMLLCMENQRDCEIDVLKAMFFMSSAWNQITEHTVKNCFRHAGFVEATPEQADSDEEATDDSLACVVKRLEAQKSLPVDFNIHEYLTMDDEIQVCSSCTDDDIINELVE